MTQPIGGYGRNQYVQHDQQTESSNPGLDFCRSARTVTAGVLCNEDTVVSDACRAPTNAFDQFVCDDKKMAAVQSSLWDGTKDLVKMIASVLAGRMP